jgi:hypothetical protein
VTGGVLSSLLSLEVRGAAGGAGVQGVGCARALPQDEATFILILFICIAFISSCQLNNKMNAQQPPLLNK